MRALARALALDRIHQQPDMLRRRTATSADQVDPSVFCKARNFTGEHLGRLVVMSFFIGQSRIWDTRNVESRYARERAQMIGHEVRTGRAVEAHPEQLAMRERRVERLDILTAEQRAHRLDGARHCDCRNDSEYFDR